MTMTGADRNTALTMQEYGWVKEFDSERVAQNNHLLWPKTATPDRGDDLPLIFVLKHF
jgi:hypothetical protein